MREHLVQLARYNQWANGRILDTASDLSDAARRQDTGGFFESLHGTINHMLVAEQVWLARWTGEPSPHDTLDIILHEDWTHLKAARRHQDDTLIALVQTQSDAQLAEDLRYSNMAGMPLKLQKGLILLHLFNHATHHRGQCHHMIHALGGQAPVLDLPFFLLGL
ncbi:MAG: DUF664 domain-containing protein [Alphaproteobacteria bacterium]|nr:DUF664 domain-containing protein [Alphaproteobacteria bacterium]